MKLARAVNIADLRRMAQARLPRSVFDFFDGGAEDETTLRGNREAFERVRLLPRVLVDVHAVDTGVELFGARANLPMAIAPTGAIGAGRHDSRRVDDQLRGRAGRQGDPGGSVFFVSLEDELVTRHAGDILPASPRMDMDGVVHDEQVDYAAEHAQRVRPEHSAAVVGFGEEVGQRLPATMSAICAGVCAVLHTRKRS